MLGTVLYCTKFCLLTIKKSSINFKFFYKNMVKHAYNLT